MSDLQFDVVVVGGGMAGLAAAVTAGAEGARVAVLEKTSAIGGSAAISSGYLWTAPDFETLKSRIPLGDSDLGRILVSDFEDVVELVRSTGVELSPRVGGLLGFGQGYVVDIKGLFERWASKIEGRGGWIVPRTSAVRLHRGADGVDGVLTTGPDGQLEISARSVVLATGGFQGDRALMASFIGLDAAEMPVRSAPGSVGDGFRMASDVGAAASSALGAFYGHLIPSPLSRFEEPDFLPLTQYHSNRCLLVNRRGDRFMDETAGDEHANQAVLRQPDSRAVLLADERIRREYVITEPYDRGEVIDRFEVARGSGARYCMTTTLSALASQVAEWGVDEGGLRATLESQKLLTEAPFHALEVQPTITFPHGGIRIDSVARVLDRDDQPIAGLFAAGADAGGLFNRGYAGGLAAALVFGVRAGRNARTQGPELEINESAAGAAQ